MHFLFQEGIWRGLGTVSFSASASVLSFRTEWNVLPIEAQRFRAVQTVEVAEQPPMINIFTVQLLPSGAFQLFLKNESLGVFSGQGVFDDTNIAWEFAHQGALEGMEVYERAGPATYSFHAEYLGGKGFSTLIRGEISRLGDRREGVW